MQVSLTDRSTRRSDSCHSDFDRTGGRPAISRSVSLAIILLAIGLMTTALACSEGETNPATAAETRESEPESKSAARRAIPVETWKIESRDFHASFEVPGVVTAQRDVRVAFETNGRITKIYVDEGDEVRRGETLARVSTDVDRARIELLKSQLETAKREYKRVKSLADEGLASERELDQADAQLESARLNLKQAKVTLNNSTVTAPISGQVAARRADEGEFASPGVPLIDIVDATKLQLEVSIPEGRIKDIESGMTMKVEFPALDTEVDGTVPYMPTRIESRTRTYPVEVRIPTDKLDKSGATLRPGMRADVTVPYRSFDDATVVPRTAVLLGYDTNEVVVLPDPEADVPRAKVRKVKLGPSRGNRVVVTDGLQSGDTIVVTGHRALTDNAPVEVVNALSSLDQAGVQ